MNQENKYRFEFRRGDEANFKICTVINRLSDKQVTYTGSDSRYNDLDFTLETQFLLLMPERRRNNFEIKQMIKSLDLMKSMTIQNYSRFQNC